MFPNNAQFTQNCLLSATSSGPPSSTIQLNYNTLLNIWNSFPDDTFPASKLLGEVVPMTVAQLIALWNTAPVNSYLSTLLNYTTGSVPLTALATTLGSNTNVLTLSGGTPTWLAVPPTTLAQLLVLWNSATANTFSFSKIL